MHKGLKDLSPGRVIPDVEGVPKGPRLTSLCVDLIVVYEITRYERGNLLKYEVMRS